MSTRYTKQPLNVKPLSGFPISRWKVAGAWHRPNGMTLKWKRPIGVEAVFSRSGSATSTCQYPEARSSVLNHWDPASASNVSSMRGRG
ncbi:hypothetical protein T10_1688 [Trichinella papuae]|uniref:Uncharacterized protein n=1 Tax=Trichinella papuae TaxID=268474 RepID=A0A0V1N6A4_9BILA|nr:hypothetical protein T10_1688 [Trichinella papuae]